MARRNSLPLIQVKLDRATYLRSLRAMKELPERVYAKVVGQAANYAMTPVLKDARRRCPRRDGLLAKSLGKKLKKYKRSGSAVVLVGPRKGFKDIQTGADPVNYAHLVEFGTGPHRIPDPGTGLKIGPIVIRGTVDHPGARPQPFLRPALDGNKVTVLERYRKKLGTGIEREATKLGKGG